MATEIALPGNTWTKIGNNLSEMSWQNAGQIPFYINFTATDVAPTDDVGFIYSTFDDEIKRTLTGVTYVATPLYVWAKPVTGKTGKVIVETP